MSKFEKKSERIEIRVSHSKKQAFNEACETSGDTSSGALRRFIDGYIRRADKDAFADGFRAMGRMARRRWLPLGTIAALLLVGGYYTGQALRSAPHDGPIVTASTAEFPPINYALFAAYDKNANGVLDLGEVAENDEHLHRVLNLDGEAGIAPAEFYEKGYMEWNYIKRNSLQTGQDENGPTATTMPVENEVERIVKFDLRNSAAPIISISNPSNESLEQPKISNIDRSVSWEKGSSMPALSFSNHDFEVRASLPHKVH